MVNTVLAGIGALSIVGLLVGSVRAAVIGVRIARRRRSERERGRGISTPHHILIHIDEVNQEIYVTRTSQPLKRGKVLA